MAEKLELDLELVDKIAGPAKKAADALRGIESAAQKAQSALGLKSTAASDQATIKAASKQQSAFANSWAKIGMAAEKERIRQEKATEKAAVKHQKAFADSWAKIGMAATKAQSSHAEHESWLGKGAEEFGHKLRNAVAAAAIAEVMFKGVEKVVDFLKEGVMEAFKIGAHEEKQTLAFRLTLGEHGGKEAQEDVDRFYKKSGFTQSRAEDMMLGLRRTGFSAKNARTAIAAAGDVEAGGGARAEDTLEFLKKIQLKGGVSKKELVGLNINVNEFYKKLSKSLGTDVEGAKKKSEEGGIDPALIRDLIYAGIEKSQGGKIGTGSELASKTMGARFEKLQNLPEQYLKHMSESPAWKTLSEKLGGVLEGLDPESENGKKIMASLFSVFGKLANAIGSALTPANIDKFAAAISSAVEFLTKIPAIINTIVTVSEVLATIWAGSKIVGIFSTLASIMPTLGTGLGAVTLAVGGIAAPLLAAAAAAGALATAFVTIQNAAKDLGGWDRVAKDFKSWIGGETPASANDDINSNSPQWKKDRAAGVSAATPFHVAKGGNRATNINVPQINVEIHPAKDDTNHTKQTITQEIFKASVTGFELASMQGGG